MLDTVWFSLFSYGQLLAIGASFCLGILFVVVYVAHHHAEQLLSSPALHPVPPQSSKTLSPPSYSKQEPPATVSCGSQRVDYELEQLLQLCLQDYVEAWYHPYVSADTSLLLEARVAAKTVAENICNRCRGGGFLPSFTESLVDIFLDHLQRFKTALHQAGGGDKGVEKLFLGEDEAEGWAVVCSSKEAELAYVRGIAEQCLMLVLPDIDYSNPLFRTLSQDVLAEQLLLRACHHVTTPYYINSTLVSLCKDSALTGDSFTTALSFAPPEVVAVARSLASREITRLRRAGKTEQDHLELSSLKELDTLLQELEDKSDAKEYADNSSQFPTLSVMVPDIAILQDTLVKHAHYKIEVVCQHQQGPQEKWTIQRKFSDIHDLYLTLRPLLGPAANDLPQLPTQIKLNRIDPSMLEARRQWMQSYLQALSAKSFLSAHPQIFHEAFIFLSGGSYLRKSTEIGRAVDRLVGVPLRASVRSMSLRDDGARTSSPNTFRRILSSASSTDESPSGLEDEEEEEEEEDGLAILLTLLDEVFDVAEGDKWLQRQLSHVLRQLLRATLSDKMGRKIMEALDSLASADHVADLLAEFRQSLWPQGYQAASRKRISSDILHLTSLLAHTKLIGSVPDDLRRLLGSGTTHQGISRLFNMFQHQQLNLRLFYRVMEALLTALFPERDLTPAFGYLRKEIQLKHHSF